MNAQSIATRIALSIAAPVAAIGLLAGCASDDSSKYCIDDQHRLQQDNSQCDNHAHGYVYVVTRNTYTYDPSKATVVPDDSSNTFVDPSNEEQRSKAGLPKEGPVEVHTAPVEEPHVNVPEPEVHVPSVHVSVR